MISTYIQVSNVLEKVRQCHEQRADVYAGLSQKTEKENIRMYLGYMSRGERHMASVLADYCMHAPRTLLDTWMQYGPNYDLLAVPVEPRSGKEMTTDEVVDLSLQQADRRTTFYAEAVQFVDIDELRELFNSLKALEEAQKKDITQNALYLKRDI
jgi:hypothetical protein